MAKEAITIALAGNPNSGKTTVFNALTGARQHVGNWPGVTVEQKEGRLSYEGYDIKVVDLPGGTYVERELILIKLSVTSATRSQVIEIVNIFRAKIVDISQDSMTVEVTGTGEKIEAMLNILRPLGLKEVARTGKVAMLREMNKNGKNSK